MKIKHIVGLFILGICFTTIGALFKLMHWPGAQILLIIGMSMEALSGLLFIAKLFLSKNQNIRKLMDS